jgi:hypothetical protein
MTLSILRFTETMYGAVWDHLVCSGSGVEEAAFAYAARTAEEPHLFDVVDWFPVAPSGFESRSAYHLELTDETRARAIKRAHDLGASLVELHSHVEGDPARFSWSDLSGFREFVPHVWWRLKGKPYFAIVAAPKSYDGFAWHLSPDDTERLGAVSVGAMTLSPTHASKTRMEGPDDG